MKTVNYKPKIVVDIDDVLADMVPALIERINDLMGSNLGVEDYTENMGDVLGLELEEVSRLFDEFFANSNPFYSSLKPIEQAREALQRLSHDYDIVALTSRRQSTESVTKKWLEQNLGGLVGEVHFSGAFETITADSHKRNKNEQLLMLDADWLIDDQPKHVNSAAELGIKAILFGDYPWSDRQDIHPDVLRARDWVGVLRIIEGATREK
ncbi:MAG: hypothetical protein LBK50_00995 [Candidatus Nomurabacteria bacterium]|nr:hypothetical protein [Candidatus Nomurabacteria bacterium]